MMRRAAAEEDNKFRWWLARIWDDALPRVMFVMLNPSTADADVDDPTIRRCIGLAKNRGYGTLFVCNLFPYRATHPKDLKEWIMASDTRRLGAQLSRNDDVIKGVASCSHAIVVAWGAHGDAYAGVAPHTLSMLRQQGKPVYALGFTKHGHPRHPLYLPTNVEWINYG